MHNYKLPDYTAATMAVSTAAPRVPSIKLYELRDAGKAGLADVLLYRSG